MGFGFLWCAISRNNIVLTEVGEDSYDGAVLKLGSKILKKKINLKLDVSRTSSEKFVRYEEKKLRGLKLRVCEEDTSGGGSEHQRSSGFTWSFSCITEKSVEYSEAKKFLEKLVDLTEPMRRSCLVWQKGGQLAAHSSFSPVLLQRMDQASCNDIMNINEMRNRFSNETNSDDIDSVLLTTSQDNAFRSFSSRSLMNNMKAAMKLGVKERKSKVSSKPEGNLKGILWSAICRNETVLAETGEDNYGGAVLKLGLKLLKKKPSPGWDFKNLNSKGLQGVKFNLFEEDEYQTDHQTSSSPRLTWVFACITDLSLEEMQARSFIEKLVYLTEPMRQSSVVWREGGILSAQSTFGPTLLQRMEQVDSHGRLAMVHGSADGAGMTLDLVTSSSPNEVNGSYASNNLERTGSAYFDSMKRQILEKAESARRFQNEKYDQFKNTATSGTSILMTTPSLSFLSK